MDKLLEPPDPLALRPFLRLRCWRPGFTCFMLVFVTYGFLTWKATRDHADVGVISWYVSVVWTLPFLMSALGMAGSLRTAHRLRHAPLPSAPLPDVDDLLIVVVPTVARADTCT